MSHLNGNGNGDGNGNWGNNWNWWNRNRRIVVVRQLVPIVNTYPALSNPGVTGDCYLRMENLRATYIRESERLKTMINQCQVVTKDYLQLKLQSIATGNGYAALARAKEQELYNLNLQKNQLEVYLRDLYNAIVSSTC